MTTTALARRPAELALAPPVAPGQRARQLLAEARRASFDHLDQLAASIDATRRLAADVVDAGDLYAPGVRDLAERLADELFWRAKSLEKLTRPPHAAAEPARGVG